MEDVEISIKETEEYPTDEGKRVKIIDIPVMTQEDKKRIDSALDKIEKLTHYLEEKYSGDIEKKRFDYMTEKLETLESLLNEADARKSIPMIIELIEELKDLNASLKENQDRIVGVLGKTVENMENVNKDIGQIRADIEAALTYIRGIVNEYVSIVSKDAEGIYKKIESLVQDVNEKLDKQNTIVSTKLDNLALQTIEPMNDLSLVIDKLRNEIADTKQVIPIVVEKSVNSSSKKVLSELKKINSQLTAMRSENTLAVAENLIKLVKSYRVPKSAQNDKKIILIALNGVEDGLTDMFVLKTVTKKMTKTEILQVTKLNNAKLSKSINRLVNTGNLVKERKGRLTVFRQK